MRHLVAEQVVVQLDRAEGGFDRSPRPRAARARTRRPRRGRARSARRRAGPATSRSTSRAGCPLAAGARRSPRRGRTWRRAASHRVARRCTSGSRRRRASRRTTRATPSVEPSAVACAHVRDPGSTARASRLRPADAAGRRSGRSSRSTARCVHASSCPRSSARRPATVRAASTAGPAHSPTTRSSGRTSGGVCLPARPNGLPLVVLLHPRDHYAEPGDLPDDLAAECGVLRLADRAGDPQHRRHRPGARLPVGRRLRTPPLVVHGAAGTDPATDRQLRGDLGRHPAGHAGRRSGRATSTAWWPRSANRATR